MDAPKTRPPTVDELLEAIKDLERINELLRERLEEREALIKLLSVDNDDSPDEEKNSADEEWI